MSRPCSIASPLCHNCWPIVSKYICISLVSVYLLRLDSPLCTWAKNRNIIEMGMGLEQYQISTLSPHIPGWEQTFLFHFFKIIESSAKIERSLLQNISLLQNSWSSSKWYLFGYIVEPESRCAGQATARNNSLILGSRLCGFGLFLSISSRDQMEFRLYICTSLLLGSRLFSCYSAFAFLVLLLLGFRLFGWGIILSMNLGIVLDFRSVRLFCQFLLPN